MQLKKKKKNAMRFGIGPVPSSGKKRDDAVCNLEPAAAITVESVRPNIFAFELCQTS